MGQLLNDRGEIAEAESLIDKALEGQRRVLGHGVGRRSRLAQQACGRNDLEEIALAALEHRGQPRARRVEMGAEVAREDALPIFVGRVDAGVLQRRLHCCRHARAGQGSDHALAAAREPFEPQLAGRGHGADGDQADAERHQRRCGDGRAARPPARPAAAGDEHKHAGRHAQRAEAAGAEQEGPRRDGPVAEAAGGAALAAGLLAFLGMQMYSPFDIVLAPQEIPIGPPTEYNSTFLGLMMSGRAIFVLIMPRPPRTTLFPCATLCRSDGSGPCPDFATPYEEAAARGSDDDVAGPELLDRDGPRRRVDRRLAGGRGATARLDRPANRPSSRRKKNHEKVSIYLDRPIIDLGPHHQRLQHPC